MGTPENRLGLLFNLANLVKMESQAYFMTGSQIPDSPPPPSEVAAILGIEADKLHYMRDLNGLGTGKGMAFGGKLAVATGDLTFLLLYADFHAGLGFDIMLKDYGEARCAGRSGSIGIDGWYANGQAYAYLQGELGVKVKLLAINKKFPIIRGGAATLMQAKLPNPSWFAGYLGVSFDVLNGLVKGSASFKISLGEECEIENAPGSNPFGVEVISDLNPSDKASQVDVFAAPQAAFNLPVGKVIELEEDRAIKQYRFTLDGFTVTEKGNPIPGKLEWNAELTTVSFYSHEVLPPVTELKAKVQISLEEQVDGRWIPVYTGGKKAEESLENVFTTSTVPDYIPLQNIEYCYPVAEQQFYYPKESNQAYIQLKRGQGYLFREDMRHEAHFIKGESTHSSSPITYHSEANRITYTSAPLETRSEYTFQLYSFSKGEGSTQAVTLEKSYYEDEQNKITERHQQAGTEIRDQAGKSILNYPFKSSAYNTFAEKMKALKKGEAFVGSLNFTTDYYLTYSINGGEVFDLTELTGSVYSAHQALIKAQARLNDTYYQRTIGPLLYKNYPLHGFEIKERKEEPFGIPPAGSIPILTEYITDIERGIFTNWAQKIFAYSYDVARLYKQDYYDLRTQIIEKHVKDLFMYKDLSDFACTSFPGIVRGDYEIELLYTFPDGTRGSRAVFGFYNPLR